MMILLRFAIILLFSAQLAGCYTLVVPSTCEQAPQSTGIGGGRGDTGGTRR